MLSNIEQLLRVTRSQRRIVRDTNERCVIELVAGECVGRPCTRGGSFRSRGSFFPSIFHRRIRSELQIKKRIFSRRRISTFALVSKKRKWKNREDRPVNIGRRPVAGSRSDAFAATNSRNRTPEYCLPRNDGNMN